MDLMDDDDLKKDVISQMMGELDDVSANGLKKKPDGSAKGVEISITVSPKTGDEPGEDMEKDGDCMDPDCEDPMHDHSARDATQSDGEGDYISELLKKLG